MAFVSTSGGLLYRRESSLNSCRVRMATEESNGVEKQSPPSQRVTNEAPVAGRKLVRNIADLDKNIYAEAKAGDMVNAPKVGEGLGPRRGVKDKKVTRAAAIQKSQSFADAWAEQNQGRVDIWLIIGAITLLTPLIILIWGVLSGAIPTGGLFEADM